MGRSDAKAADATPTYATHSSTRHFVAESVVANNMNATCAIETATGNGFRSPASGTLVDGTPLGLPQFCILTCHHCIADADILNQR